jgi:hypothetical protein
VPVAVWERLVLDCGLPVPFTLLGDARVPRAVRQNGAVEERSDDLIVVVCINRWMRFAPPGDFDRRKLQTRYKRLGKFG